MATLKRLCMRPGCGNLAFTGSSLCKPHKLQSNERRALRKREADLRRPSPQERGYDKRWRQTRGRYLKHNPRCETCGVPAVEVDHIVPISEGGARLQWSNLQSQCKPCHSRKTANEFRRADGTFGR